MILVRRSLGLVLAAGAFALAGCVSTVDPEATAAAPTPTVLPKPPTGPVVTQRSSESLALERYYARLQQNFLTQGLLRVDGGGPDTPFNARQLTENFVRIALFEEFSARGTVMVKNESSSTLHRWREPVRMKVVFGDSVPLANRERDRAEIIKFARRLGRITGHPITVTDQSPNFHVFILNEDERRVIGPQLRAISPEVDVAAVNSVQNMNRNTLCLAFAIDPGQDGIYTKAAAIVRGEHPDLMRLSCIHEEIAQAMGLPNDSPMARPSIFNDDEEFGLLTTHDELLLRMLYDPRMRPGMNATTARPIAQTIANELLGGES